MFSCQKDKVKFVNVYSNEVTKYSITLTNNEISAYSKYINNNLQEAVTINDMDSVVVVVTKNNMNQVTSKETYIIGNDSVAELGIDSIFSNEGIRVEKNTYYFNSGFLFSQTIHWVNYYATADSGNYTLNHEYDLDDDNIFMVTNSVGCVNSYGFYSTLNKINLTNFRNSFLGKYNKNLIKEAHWLQGCPDGPSMTIAFSEYQYDLNNNNYVTKKTETYTPSYHTDMSQTVSRKVTTTLYEYQTK